jgi:hypothetical protein
MAEPAEAVDPLMSLVQDSPDRGNGEVSSKEDAKLGTRFEFTQLEEDILRLYDQLGEIRLEMAILRAEQKAEDGNVSFFFFFFLSSSDLFGSDIWL